MKLEPRFVEKPWGGTWLGQHYGVSGPALGEAWLLSTLPEGELQLDGKNLSESVGALNFVVKIIDAAEPLSVQVHPDDEWARKLENSKGKTECWLILNAQPGAGVYLGVREGVSADRFSKALDAASSSVDREVEKLIEFYPVKRGDFITVPAGTIHAIGGGVTLLEVQQSSGITYRLWDWNRPAREMHIEKGMKVASFEKRFAIHRDAFKQNGLLMDHADFDVFLNESEGDGWFIDLETYDVYRASKAHSASYVFVR